MTTRGTPEPKTHTPGLWTAHDEEDATGALPCVLTDRVNAGGNFYVAQCNAFADARLIAAAPKLLATLEGLNHMGGDDRGGYCICPARDGSAPDARHSTSCADARAAIRQATED